jgi:exodeoxyribonuclease-5
MKFNTDQLHAIEQMCLFMASNQSFFILSGYAGTGKTTVTQHFIETLHHMTIAMTAPTNQAVEVLQKMASPSSKHIVEYLTIYKLLDLGLDFEDDDKVLIEKDTLNSKLKEYDLVIIDEASMINAQLFETIIKIAKRRRVKFILVGDPVQWLPVKENVSPVFSEDKGFPIAKLTQVMRVVGGNPLLLVVDQVRERVLTPELWDQRIELESVCNDDRSQGYFELDWDKWLATMIKAFNSEQWKEDSSFVRAIAWTNRAVDRLNVFIRNNIYDDARVPYLEGERLIAKDSIFNGEEIIITNSSEMEIIWAEPGFDKRYDLKTWVMLVATKEGLRHQLTVLDRGDYDTAQKYNQMLAELADTARNETYLRKQAWGKYWTLKDKTYASVNYLYALTSHKAQGSTFAHVFVDQKDILKNPKGEERYRGLYVAYSRASHRVMAC